MLKEEGRERASTPMMALGLKPFHKKKVAWRVARGGFMRDNARNA